VVKAEVVVYVEDITKIQLRSRRVKQRLEMYQIAARAAVVAFVEAIT